MSAATDFGFNWGVAEVTRMAEIRGIKVIALKTPHHNLQISVSPTGRSVRVWLDGAEGKFEPTHEQQMEAFGEMG